MKIHFIGIGGIGISALAQFCAKRGDVISGSNAGKTSVFPILKKCGMTIFKSHNKKNIFEDCDLIVFSEAVPIDNIERKQAQEMGIPEKSYFEFLGEVLQEKKVIAVAGTHGKTTTIGLIAAGMKSANFDATVFIGSTIREFDNKNFHFGTNEFCLVEACEYRENFRFLSPEIVILTSVDFDHPDHFQDEKHYFSAFENFVKNTKTVIYHKHDLNAEKVLKNFKGKKIAVEKIFDKELQINGQKNRENATLALKLADVLKIEAAKFEYGMSNFKGASRRQELLGKKFGVNLFDDYGHHPNEIKATLAAFREKFPNAKIGLVFEPHQFSRTRVFFKEFLSAFKIADETAIFPIYATRDSEQDLKSVSIKDFLEKNPNLKTIENFNDAKNFMKYFHENDLVIFMGAGKISEFARRFLKY